MELGLNTPTTSLWACMSVQQLGEQKQDSR